MALSLKLDLMGSKHTLFRLFYRLGFTPGTATRWRESLRNTGRRQDSNGSPALPAGSPPLELGCGTGDRPSIWPSRAGRSRPWISCRKALDKARAKARSTPADVNFVHADVTHLRQAGINGPMQLIVDNGCLHNMNDDDRDSYVREVSAVAAPDARLLIVAFVPGGRFGVRGIDRAEMERRFASGWTLLSAGDEQELDREKTPTRYYLFQRRDT